MVCHHLLSFKEEKARCFDHGDKEVSDIMVDHWNTSEPQQKKMSFISISAQISTKFMQHTFC
jgi:hypothetical protein